MTFENLSGNTIAKWIKPKLLNVILYNLTPNYFAINTISGHLLPYIHKLLTIHKCGTPFNDSTPLQV